MDCKELAMKDNTILIIEDDETNRNLIRSVIALGKCEILEADNAEKGIQLAREYHPNLILMDMRLPYMDGLEATHFIKNDSHLKDIPIVALTGYPNEEDEDKAIKAGCVAFLSKPIDIRNFKKTIAMILSAYCPGYFQ
jgi:two-component system cell cycle response regulator DivK